MKVIYTLFERYPNSRNAIKELLDRGYDEDEMNAIVQAHIPKQHIDLDLGRVGVQVSETLGNRTAHGFDSFLVARKPVPLPGLGTVYAAGELATILVDVAAKHGTGADGLGAALTDFVPPDVAQAFARGVSGGSVLFWIRTDDERATVAAQTLRCHHGEYVDDHVD
jgi:hypothetical protein